MDPERLALVKADGSTDGTLNRGGKVSEICVLSGVEICLAVKGTVVKHPVLIVWYTVPE